MASLSVTHSTVDPSVYERNKEAADSENKYIVSAWHEYRQIVSVYQRPARCIRSKLQDLPYGKFRDKGIPIDNVSNFDSTGRTDRLPV